MKRPTQVKALKRSRSSVQSPTMKGAVQESQLSIDEVLGTAGPATEKVEINDENQVIEVHSVRGPATSSELRPQVGMAIRKVKEAMHSVCSFHKVD